MLYYDVSHNLVSYASYLVTLHHIEPHQPHFLIFDDVVICILSAKVTPCSKISDNILLHRIFSHSMR